MLLGAFMVSGQITMRKVDGWQSLHYRSPELDLAA
jgi:hypothetical protein